VLEDPTQSPPPPLRAYAFPRTPHLPGSQVADDDGTMAQGELDELCRSCEVVLQEKLDGANVGVFFRSASEPVCQKRAGLLAGREKQQYNAFRNWVWEHVEGLWTALGTRWVLFGEWLWQTHAIRYDALPSFFIAFDLLDRGAGRFLASAAVREMVGGLVTTVPEFWRGRAGSAAKLAVLIPRLLVCSAFANTAPEGAYIRFERGGELVARAKYRRPGFAPGWQGKPRLNRLALGIQAASVT